MQDDEDLSTRPSSAFVAREDGNYQATELTRGPWDREHQHAGPPSALVAQAIARAAAPLGFTHMARLTVSLWRPIPIAELKVVVDTAYAGRNVGHFAAQLFASGKEVARFTALVQRESGRRHFTGPARSPAAARATSGQRVTAGAVSVQQPLGRLSRSDGDPGRRGRLFRRTLRGTVSSAASTRGGEEPTPIERVAVAADSGNGISAVLDFRRYLFVNNDLTINLFRRPQGEWICIDARTLVSGGSGLAEARIFDTGGLIGRSTQSLLIRLRDH